MVFLKDLFLKKVDLKNQQTTKNMQKYPACKELSKQDVTGVSLEQNIGKSTQSSLHEWSHYLRVQTASIPPQVKIDHFKALK